MRTGLRVLFFDVQIFRNWRSEGLSRLMGGRGFEDDGRQKSAVGECGGDGAVSSSS